MGFRFSRRIKLTPGVRINLSKSGVSTSLGRRGSFLTFGSKGTRSTVGVPGTGLSYTGTSRRVGSRGAVVLLFVVVIVLIVLTDRAFAQAIQKCAGADGRVVYQDVPCAAGKVIGQVERDVTRPDPAASRRAELVREELAERAAGLAPVSTEERILLRYELPRYLAAARSNDVDEMCRYGRQIVKAVLIAKDELAYQRWKLKNDDDCARAAQRRAEPTAAPALSSNSIDNKSRAGERRFITKDIKASEEDIRGRLGTPDRTRVDGSHWVWIYDPTDADQQTRTTIWFYRGSVANAARDVVR